MIQFGKLHSFGTEKLLTSSTSNQHTIETTCPSLLETYSHGGERVNEY